MNTQDTRTETLSYKHVRTDTECSYRTLKPFYFAHRTTGDLACGHLGDYNVDTLGSRHLGSEVRKTMIWANHMTTGLGFPPGFQMVKFGFCSSSKEAERPPQGGERAVNYQRPLQVLAGDLELPVQTPGTEV